MDQNSGTIISSLVTLIVGLFAFVIYRIEKTDKDSAAASIVMEEIRSIENTIDKYKDSKDLFNILPANLTTSGWLSYRYGLVKFLDRDEMSQLSSFFERTEVLKDLISQWRELYFYAMKQKSSFVQSHLADFAMNKEPYDEQKSMLQDKFENEEHWFEPFLYKDQIDNKIKLYTPISITSIGDKLKTVANKKWYRF